MARGNAGEGEGRGRGARGRAGTGHGRWLPQGCVFIALAQDSVFMALAQDSVFMALAQGLCVHGAGPGLVVHGRSAREESVRTTVQGKHMYRWNDAFLKPIGTPFLRHSPVQSCLPCRTNAVTRG